MQTFTSKPSLTTLSRNLLRPSPAITDAEQNTQPSFHHLLQAHPKTKAQGSTQDTSTEYPSSVAYSFVSLQKLMQSTQANQTTKQAKRKHKER